jgi:hypothetical protein
VSGPDRQSRCAQVTETTDSPAAAPSPGPRPHHTARWIAGGVGTVVVVIGIVLALNVGTNPTATSRQSALLGKPAPSFHLPTLDAMLATARGQR